MSQESTYHPASINSVEELKAALADGWSLARKHHMLKRPAICKGSAYWRVPDEVIEEFDKQKTGVV